MIKGKKGQVVLFAFMLMIVVIIMAMGISYSIREGATISMSNMNCTNTTISDYTKAACYVTDINPAFFIAALLGIGGVIIAARIILT